MEYEFYMDVFFFVDFYLNVLSLSLSAVFLRMRRSYGRVCFAAALGSFWNCFLFLYPLPSVWLELGVTVFLIGSIMLRIAFPVKGLSKLAAAVGSFLTAAGLLNGCFSFSQQHFFLSDAESLIFTGLICLSAERFLRYRNKRESMGKQRCQVFLYYRGRKKQFSALADSGNRLREPATGKPVAIISYHDCKDFCDSVSGGFYIPYKAVGTEQGMLFAVVFEKMEVQINGKGKTIENPVVAIAKETLSAQGDFSMILPEEYVPEE